MSVKPVAGKAFAGSLAILFASLAFAAPPPATVEYQPMVSTGLAADKPFEAWFVFDKAFDNRVKGYEVPAGAKIRFTFPSQFTAAKDLPLVAVMIRWTQGAIPAKFAVTQDAKDPRVVEIQFVEGISTSGPQAPGMKAIHLLTPEINPKAGEYPIAIEFIDAGPISGTTHATARITPAPVPNIAFYNQLHNNENENWQHVAKGADVPLPIDFLITIPDDARSSMSLKPTGDGSLNILSFGKKIGTITTAGAKVFLTPKMFGPGYARLGIVEVQAKAGMDSGIAQIKAQLDGGTQSTVNVVIE